MEDKELAEKVAEKLGWKYCESCGVWVSKEPFELQVKADENTQSIMELITTGNGMILMIEKAESMGWTIKITGTYRYEQRIQFHTRRNSYGGTLYMSTTIHETKKHGHIKACALAFVEIPIDKAVDKVWTK